MAGRLTVRWMLAGLGLALSTGSLVAGTGTDEPWIRGVFTGHSPRPVGSLAENAWREAEYQAQGRGDALVLLGTGRSMQPLYPGGTLLVIARAEYDSLRSGQTVIYRNRAGRAVAHVLIARTRDGWRARGLNNRLHDMEPVRRENLLGVVVAAYAPDVGQLHTGPRDHRTAFFLANE